MWETVIVWIVVGGVAAMAIWSFIRTLNDENAGCGSSGCCGCSSRATACCEDDANSATGDEGEAEKPADAPQ